MSQTKTVYYRATEPAQKYSVDLDLETILHNTRVYWTTTAKHPLAEGTLKSTEDKIVALYRKLGGISLDQEWVSRAVARQKSDGLSPGSINNYMFCIKRALIANGVKGVTVPVDSKYRAPEHTFFTIEQVHGMIASASNKCHRAIIATLYYQALRVGEMRHMTMDCLNTKDMEMRVYGQKTRRWRNIPINPNLVPHLNEWLEVRERAASSMKKDGAPVPANVFFNIRGKLFSEDAVRAATRSAATRAGFSGKMLAESHPHTLRHSMSHHLLHVYKWDLSSVAYFIGDSVTTTNNTYVHTNKDTCRDLMARMSR